MLQVFKWGVANTIHQSLTTLQSRTPSIDLLQQTIQYPAVSQILPTVHRSTASKSAKSIILNCCLTAGLHCLLALQSTEFTVPANIIPSSCLNRILRVTLPYPNQLCLTSVLPEGMHSQATTKESETPLPSLLAPLNQRLSPIVTCSHNIQRKKVQAMSERPQNLESPVSSPIIYSEADASSCRRVEKVPGRCRGCRCRQQRL